MSDKADGTDVSQAERDAPPAGTPRWVKFFVLVGLVLAVLLVVVVLVTGGGHGPGRHRSSDDRGAPPVGAHTQP